MANRLEGFSESQLLALKGAAYTNLAAGKLLIEGEGLDTKVKFQSIFTSVNEMMNFIAEIDEALKIVNPTTYGPRVKRTYADFRGCTTTQENL